MAAAKPIPSTSPSLSHSGIDAFSRFVILLPRTMSSLCHLEHKRVLHIHIFIHSQRIIFAETKKKFLPLCAEQFFFPQHFRVLIRNCTQLHNSMRLLEFCISNTYRHRAANHVSNVRTGYKKTNKRYALCTSYVQCSSPC